MKLSNFFYITCWIHWLRESPVGKGPPRPVTAVEPYVEWPYGILYRFRRACSSNFMKKQSMISWACSERSKCTYMDVTCVIINQLKNIKNRILKSYPFWSDPLLLDVCLIVANEQLIQPSYWNSLANKVQAAVHAEDHLSSITACGIIHACTYFITENTVCCSNQSNQHRGIVCGIHTHTHVQVVKVVKT